MEFTSPFCRTAGLSVHDLVSLNIQLADTSTPQELQSIFVKSNELEVAWLALPERERSDAGEHIRAAKTQVTRERRAATVADRLRGIAKP